MIRLLVIWFIDKVIYLMCKTEFSLVINQKSFLMLQSILWVFFSAFENLNFTRVIHSPIQALSGPDLNRARLLVQPSPAEISGSILPFKTKPNQTNFMPLKSSYNSKIWCPLLNSVWSFKCISYQKSDVFIDWSVCLVDRLKHMVLYIALSHIS